MYIAILKYRLNAVKIATTTKLKQNLSILFHFYGSPIGPPKHETWLDQIGLERKVRELYLATWVTTLYSKSIPSSSPSPLLSSPLKALVGILGVGGMTNGRGPKVVKTSAVLVDLKRYKRHILWLRFLTSALYRNNSEKVKCQNSSKP